MADLEGSSFDGAILDGANLDGADLTGAFNLSIDQLYKVKTLYATILDEALLISLKKYPTRFEKLDK